MRMVSSFSQTVIVASPLAENSIRVGESSTPPFGAPSTVETGASTLNAANKPTKQSCVSA